MTIKMIVGLRNPGERYAKTRHNVGAWLLEQLAEQTHQNWLVKKDFFAELTEFQWSGHKVQGVLPTTFMNLSGQAVSAIARFYKYKPEDILVIHDDLDLNVGAIRLKKGGGHGGHNGLQDIIRHLASPDFYRLRLGIGHPGDKQQVANYVLNTPSQSERQVLEQAIQIALPHMQDIVFGEMEKVMNSLHRR